MSIDIYTDGSCSPNPGFGGWGFVIYSLHTKSKWKCGYVNEITTNNKMEIMAITKSLLYIYQNEKYTHVKNINIYTDSNYVKGGLVGSGDSGEGWIKGWMKKGFLGVKNKRVWIELYDIFERVKKEVNINVYHTRAHVGNKRNERADELANRGRMLNPNL